jgi:glyoxylase-like metal-dependent hydrolase (beta-lactamase superfamily II)
MTNFICVTCGTQFAASEHVPDHCPICEDERQYIGHDGQQWTTLEDLHSTYSNTIKLEEPGLYGIGSMPRFAIGQRALLVQHPEGNVLWDCVSLLDQATVKRVNELGGIQKIVISHPHFYSSMIEWAHTFGASIHLPIADRQWLNRPDPSIQFWDDDSLELQTGLTVIRCGGHFDGSSVLHWQAGTNGQGVLLTGDTITVVADRRFLTFMRSYPNQIPLHPDEIRRIWNAVEPFKFERIYGGWWEAIVPANARERVRVSAERYLQAIGTRG